MMKKYEVKEKKPKDLDPDDLEGGDWLNLSIGIEHLIVDLGAKWCTSLSFTLCGTVTYNDTCEYFLELLSPYLIKKYSLNEETNDIIFVYKVCDETIREVRRFRFDLFLAPDLPENISLFYGDGCQFLSSITHEGWYELNLDASRLTSEEFQLLSAFFEESKN